MAARRQIAGTVSSLLIFGRLRLCAATAFVVGFNTQSFISNSPALGADWHLSPSELGLFFSAGPLGVMLGAIVLAPLGDRFGRRPAVISCIALLGGCSLASAACATALAIGVFHFFFGLGVGGVAPNIIATVSECAPVRHKFSAITFTLSCLIAGSSTGGLIAAQILPVLGFRAVFFLSGSVALAALPLLFAGLPESARFLELRDMRHAGNAEHKVVQSVLRSGWSHEMQFSKLFRHGRARNTLLLLLVMLMSLMDFFFLINWLPITMRGLGAPLWIAIGMGTLLHVGGISAGLLGHFFERLAPNVILCAAQLVGATCIGVIGLAGTNFLAVAVAVFGAGLGIMGGQMAADAITASLYPSEIRSTGIGLVSGVGRIGAFLGPSLAGVCFSSGESPRTVFLFMALPALLAGVAASALAASPPTILSVRCDGKALARDGT